MNNPAEFIPENNIVFLDSMVWIQAYRDKSFKMKLAKWLCGPPQLFPLIHSALEFEILACDDESEFEELWELISHHPRLNYSPIQLMRSEIGWKICKKADHDFMRGILFRYKPEHLLQHKVDLRKNLHQIRAEKTRQAGSENFIKIADRKSYGILESTKLRPLIAQAMATNLDDMPSDDGFFAANVDAFAHKTLKNKQGAVSETRRIIEHYNSQSAKSVIHKEIQTLNAIERYGYPVTEDTTYGEFADMVFLLEMAHDAYNDGHFESLSSTEVVSRIVRSQPTDYPGFHALRTISKAARSSGAKAKQGDQMDFMNSILLPYTDHYVTDANIAEIVRQTLPQYSSKIHSFSELSAMLDIANDQSDDQTEHNESMQMNTNNRKYWIPTDRGDQANKSVPR